MEIPEKKKTGRPATDKSTPEVREFWRRRYYEKKARLAREAQPIIPKEEEGETQDEADTFTRARPQLISEIQDKPFTIEFLKSAAREADTLDEFLESLRAYKESKPDAETPY